MDQVFGNFSPLAILGKFNNDDKNFDLSQLKFDSVAIFQIAGQKFEAVDACDFGILDSSKAYFIIFSRGNDGFKANLIKDLHAIYLWRGD